MAVPMFLAMLGIGIGPFVTSPVPSLALVTLGMIGCWSGMGVWWTVPTSFLSGAAAAGAAGLINSVGNIGGFLGPYMMGYIKDSTGTFQSAYIFLATCFLLAGLIMLTLKKQPVD